MQVFKKWGTTRCRPLAGVVLGMIVGLGVHGGRLEAAEPSATPTRGLHLQVFVRTAVPPECVSVALAEVRAIWRPYGVNVTWSPGPAVRGTTGVRVLRVVIDEGTPAGDWTAQGPLAIGWIEFVEPNRPRDVVHLSLASVRRLLAVASLAGRPLSDRPVKLQHRFIARALGRSLAHEIGHFLLASPRHEARGLMRAHFTPTEFLADASGRYALASFQVATLSTWSGSPDEMARPHEW